MESISMDPPNPPGPGLSAMESRLRRPVWRRAPLIGLAIGLAVTAGLYLFLTAQPPERGHRIFGLWRDRHFLIACGLFWLALLTCMALVSRRLLFLWIRASLLVGMTWAILELAGLLGLVSYHGFSSKTPFPNSLGAKPIPLVDIRGTTFSDSGGPAWGLPKKAIPFHYKTDRRGYRNRHDRSEADLYLVGDSMLVAGLVPLENTVTARLEVMLRRPTMTLALIGIGPQEERDIFLTANLPMTDRLILHFVFEGNDLQDSKYYPQKISRGGKDANPAPLQRTLLYNLLQWLQHHTQPVNALAPRRIGYIDGEPYTFVYTAEDYEGVQDEVGSICQALDDMRSVVTQAGGTYAVVLVPDKLRVLGPLCRWPEGSDLVHHERHMSPLRDLLIRWCQSEGIPLLDLTDPLSHAAASGEIPWFATDVHPNEIGHRVMAEAIKNWDVTIDWRAKGHNSSR